MKYHLNTIIYRSVTTSFLNLSLRIMNIDIFEIYAGCCALVLKDNWSNPEDMKDFKWK